MKSHFGTLLYPGTFARYTDFRIITFLGELYLNSQNPDRDILGYMLCILKSAAKPWAVFPNFSPVERFLNYFCDKIRENY